MSFVKESGSWLMKGIFWGMAVFAGLAVLGLFVWLLSFAGVSLPFVG